MLTKILQGYPDLSIQRKHTIVATINQINAGLQSYNKQLNETETKEIVNKLIQERSVPTYATPEKRCEKCSGNYEDVFLCNDKPAIYCSKCRIAYPKEVVQTEG